MNDIDAFLKSTLQSCCKNVSRLVYTGKAKTYITFQYVVGVDREFADDENAGTEHTYFIHVFSKTDYLELVKNVKKALKKADFYAVTVEAEVYEADTGLYHVPLSAKYMEVINNENRT